MEKNKVCFECGTKGNYEFKDTIRVYEGDGYYFEMLVNVPFCATCGAPIYDEEIEKEIAQKANEKIRGQRKIITREEILEILKQYNISQKFLSKLLGWGEITLTRYIGGNYTPSIANSNRLKELKNPYIFQMLLQNYREQQFGEDEDKLVKKAQDKVDCELGKLSKDQGRIFSVANWFLAQSSEEMPITHLALQKLLYFTQSWSMILLEKEMFHDDCQAWAHGAVYPKVYDFFKWFKYNPLPKVGEVLEFDGNELKVLNAIKKYYFDVYNAKALEEICHREEPYIKARKGCSDGESCNVVIGKGDITSYYKKICCQFDIKLSNMVNMKQYLNLILN